MVSQASLKSVRWMLFAVFALAPTALLAQQDNPSQGQAVAAVEGQTEAKPAEADEAKGQTKAAQEAESAKTNEAQKQPETEQVETEAAQADTDATQAKTEKGPKVISGMSILGNQEAPKSLVIVPWKSSEIGKAVGVSTMLDDSRQPVDRDVFMRELSYYEIRSETKP